jgi:AraC-like DNA-binding protein
VHFPRRLLELSESVPEARAAGALLDAARGGLLLTGRTRDLVAAELEALFREPLGSWRRPLHLLAALWAAAEGAERRPLNSWDSAEGAAARDPRLRSVLAYVAANLSSGVQHAEAAAMAGLTPAAFSRFFRRATGRTFERFVSDARVSRACQALLESDAPITDVAFAAGFGSIGDFNRRFLDSTGVTPTRYRARRFRQ